MASPERALPELPASFPATREALRALACYVIAPVRKRRTGHISLRPVGDGFGTPLFDDGSRIVVRDDQLVNEPGGGVPITTLRAGAEFVGLPLSADPGVGSDLPPFAPDAALDVDAAASRSLGSWYGFGQRVLDGLGGVTYGAISQAELWPEHFDLAVTVALGGGTRVNVGFSPGDGFKEEPYLYVGPHDLGGLTGPFWNAPFGALVGYEALRQAGDPAAAATGFIVQGLQGVAERPSPSGPQPR